MFWLPLFVVMFVVIVAYCLCLQQHAKYGWKSCSSVQAKTSYNLAVLCEHNIIIIIVLNHDFPRSVISVLVVSIANSSTLTWKPFQKFIAINSFDTQNTTDVVNDKFKFLQEIRFMGSF